ncbi:MAG: hypothetical protein ACTTJS_08425 [Wolinella sp.]
MILSSGVVAYLGAESVALGLGFIACINAIRIANGYEALSFAPKQYRLFALGELSGAIIRFLLLAKWILLFYYAFLLDSFAPRLLGAMCATGVVGALALGWWLLGFKVLVLALGTTWLFAHHDDRTLENQPYFRWKFGFFALFFILMLAEYIWTLFAIVSLEPMRLVSCCATIFGSGGVLSNGASGLDVRGIYPLVFGFLLLCSGYFFRGVILFSIGNLIFVVGALYGIVYFFSPYIYEIPTHTCPFCILQGDYFGVGYLIYALLFGGASLGVGIGVRKIYARNLDSGRIMRYVLWFYTALLVILFGYVIRYFLANGVWL